MQSTYYTDGFMRQPSAPLCRRYLGIEGVTGLFTTAVPTWQDVRIPLSGTSPGIANPAVQAELFPGSDIGVWSFSNIGIRSVNFELQLPHGIDFSLPIHLHIHWTAAGLATNVQWGITATVSPILGVFAAPGGNILAPVDSLAAPYQHKVTEIVQLPVLDESELIVGRLFRNAPDGYAAPVFGLSLDAHYSIHTLGSLNELGD